MNPASRYSASRHDPQAFVTHHAYWVGLICALAVAAAFALSLALPPQDVLAGRAMIPAAPAPNPHHVVIAGENERGLAKHGGAPVAACERCTEAPAAVGAGERATHP